MSIKLYANLKNGGVIEVKHVDKQENVYSVDGKRFNLSFVCSFFTAFEDSQLTVSPDSMGPKSHEN